MRITELSIDPFSAKQTADLESLIQQGLSSTKGEAKDPPESHAKVTS